MPTEIAVPFQIGGNGRVVTASDPDDQVRQHVFAIVDTQPTERVMVPGYGIDTESLLFEDMDSDEVSTTLTSRISTAFADWEPGIGLNYVTTDPDVNGNMSKADVSFYRKDAADSGTVSNSNTAIIGASGVVREIVRG